MRLCTMQSLHLSPGKEAAAKFPTVVQSWTASSDSPKLHSPMESGSARAAAGLIAAAAALRCAAVACGIGQTYLSRRIEVSTPANGLLPLREGVALLSMGASPFQGATSHAPPLLLWSLAGIAQHPLLHAAPHVAADLLAGCLLRSVMLHAAGKQPRCDTLRKAATAGTDQG